jgi:entericidin B
MTKALRRVPADRFGLGWVAGLGALLLMAMTLSGCNTVEGMGRDVSAAGGAVSDTAEETEDAM